MSQSVSEEFKVIIRHFIARGQYPDNAAVRSALGKNVRSRSGLSTGQSRWRKEELERAGYDWQASKAKRQLVRKKLS